MLESAEQEMTEHLGHEKNGKAEFLALDERLERQVALKILAPALAADDAFRQRFVRESRARPDRRGCAVHRSSPGGFSAVREPVRTR